MKCKSRLAKKMVQKSLEAFTYAIETFNKPTITYRVESFAYLICNAWELLLKAYWIETRGKTSIYYIDKPERSYSLERMIKDTFTNENDPLRKNLEIVVELRNTSTHYITEEYESMYTPFFQACVLNYIDKIDEYFNVNMNEIIRFPVLAVSSYQEIITPQSFKRRYGKELYQRYMQKKQNIDKLLESPNNKMAISIDLNVAVIKDPKKADLTMALSKDADDSVTIVREIKDVNTQFPFNQKRAIRHINDRLEKGHLQVTPLNSYSFQLICNYFKLYDDASMCYLVRIDSQPRKLFSQKMLDFIFMELTKDNELVKHLKERTKK